MPIKILFLRVRQPTPIGPIQKTQRQILCEDQIKQLRLSLVLWSQLFHWKSALVIVKPGTLIGWHRSGFKAFWESKSRVGRPRLPESIRKLIVRMALENPTWGQARVVGELSVKLGIYVRHERCGRIGLPNPAREDHTEPPRSTGRRLSATTLSPSSPAIFSL